MSDPVARLHAALEGCYAIERELGEGGMAILRRGVHFAGWTRRQGHKCFRSLIWFLALLTSLGVARTTLMAQQVAWDDSWRWAEYSVRDGLPSDHVVDLVEGGEGVVWVATSAGVAWYDGYGWNPVAGLPTAVATSIVPDAEGGVFGLVEGRLYQGSERSFVPVSLTVEEPDLEVQSITPLDGGFLLLTTSAELYHWDAGQLRRVAAPVQTPPDEWRFLRIGSTRHGRLWFSTRQDFFELEGEEWCHAMQAWLSRFEDGPSGERLLATRERNRNLGTLWEQSPGEPLRPTVLNEPNAVVSLDLGPTGDAVVLFVDHTVWLVTTGTGLGSRCPRHVRETRSLFASAQTGTSGLAAPRASSSTVGHWTDGRESASHGSVRTSM